MITAGEYGLFEGADDDQVILGRYLREGVWSAGLVALLGRLLRQGGTLIDVGAHVGLVAIPVVERTPARAIAFEPEPRNFAFLRGNVQRHGLAARLEVLPLALDQAPGRVRLALSSDNSGDHRLLPASASSAGATAGGRTTVEVEAHSLDAWLAERPEARALARPIVMKLDTQGAEARVLRGAARTLPEVDYLVIEYWPAGLLRAGDSVATLRATLQGFGWGCVLGEGRQVELVPLTDVFTSLAWIPGDGSDEGFFDLLVSRHPCLPT